MRPTRCPSVSSERPPMSRGDADGQTTLLIVDAPLDVRITCAPYPDDCHAGTSVVTVVIASRVELPLMPEILGGDAPSFALDATHAVPIGQFREAADASR